MPSQKDMELIIIGDNTFIHQGGMVGVDLAILLSHVNAGELAWRVKDLNALAAIINNGIPSMNHYNGFDRSYVGVDEIPKGLIFENLYVIDGRDSKYRLYKATLGDVGKRTLYKTAPMYLRDAFCNPRHEFPIPAPREPEQGMYIMDAVHTYDEARAEGIRRNMAYGDIDEISPGKYISRVCNRKHSRRGRR